MKEPKILSWHLSAKWSDGITESYDIPEDLVKNSDIPEIFDEMKKRHVDV